GAEVLSGGDVVTSGTVRADGVVNAPVTVENGGLLQGAGTVGAVNLRSGGIVSPGNSVGTLTTTAASTNQWYGGATVYFEFKNADTDPLTAGTQGTAGTDWDYLDLVDGSLTINATSADRITIRIDSWLPNNTGHGQADSFDPSGSYRWLFVRATGGITFTSGTDVFELETTTPGFGVFGTGNPYTMVPGGNFRIAAIGNELYIEYDAVPEPSSLALTSLAGAAALSRGNRLRRWVKRRET
ncbi:MAG: PEP-CTERM sorting domain-containing protein, partial [Planctomycetales bacterium]|nr:PEP-CTERM sorting domain-containing protein [Planctomycetales bacterium]